MDEELVKKKIGKKEVDDAYARLQKYKEGKAACLLIRLLKSHALTGWGSFALRNSLLKRCQWLFFHHSSAPTILVSNAAF